MVDWTDYAEDTAEETPADLGWDDRREWEEAYRRWCKEQGCLCELGPPPVPRPGPGRNRLG